MKSRGLARGCWLVVALLFAIPTVMRAAPARQTAPPTLHEILQRLEENLDQYKARIPSIFCDEHLVSKADLYRLYGPQEPKLDTVTNSVFRLKRVLNRDGTTTLIESRNVTSIDGRPANGRDVSDPTLLIGAFSGGLSLVSLSQQSCMRYTLKPIKLKRPKTPYIIEFVSVPSDQRTPGCLLQDDGSGRVFIDRASMQIIRIEIKVPHHSFSPTTSVGTPMPRLVGIWNIAALYAPVVLGGRAYWLPTSITSTTKTDLVDWSFNATYRNYHKMVVTSRILPDSEALVQ